MTMIKLKQLKIVIILLILTKTRVSNIFNTFFTGICKNLTTTIKSSFDSINYERLEK